MVMNSSCAEASKRKSSVSTVRIPVCSPTECFLEEDHDKIRDEARELMKNIQQKSLESEPDRKVSFWIIAMFRCILH